VRRVTWVCGDQRVLVEEVVDTVRRTLAPSAGNLLSLRASASTEAQVWAATAQYPLDTATPRLVIIRDAEKLTRWDRLTQWLGRTRQLPGVYLLFVSNENDLPYERAEGKKAGLKAHVAAIRAPRGSLVKCSMPNEADALAWVRRRAPMNDATAAHLLHRAGGDLGEVAAVCAKLSLFDGHASTATIDALCRQRPADSFTDSLLALDKTSALLAVADLNKHDSAMLIGLLDSRLDLLQTLHHIHNAGQPLWEISGVNRYLARQYLPIARHYEPARCVYRRRVLAVVDDAFRNGARDAVWEALVALW
jgi:DNA polymerase III delta subunit